ncbi:hypothetical protein C8R45DRAFT_1100765 [Mycena sanguinolenta]|nr:hypothetical protein C8R45DRAFT_1100765 [Mycena sanguinolenta]
MADAVCGAGHEPGAVHVDAGDDSGPAAAGARTNTRTRNSSKGRRETRRIQALPCTGVGIGNAQTIRGDADQALVHSAAAPAAYEAALDSSEDAISAKCARVESTAMRASVH